MQSGHASPVEELPEYRGCVALQVPMRTRIPPKANLELSRGNRGIAALLPIEDEAQHLRRSGIHWRSGPTSQHSPCGGKRALGGKDLIR